MNWLAHLYLSEPSSAFRIGNLLPDIISLAERRALPAEYQGGIECHRIIDGFTDTHPIFFRSMARVEAPFRRYAGILVDVWYDHYLATTWNHYSAVPLDQFAAEFYASLASHCDHLPATAYARLMHMKAGNWLCSYRDLRGIRQALYGIGTRFRKPVPLGDAMSQLELFYDELREDFVEFFPELRRHVESRKLI